MIRLLIATKDNYPPFRVDVKVLFREGLASRDFRIDWIMNRDDGGRREVVFSEPRQRFFLAGTPLGLPKHLVAPARAVGGWLNHAAGVCRAFFGGYDIIQVRDLPLLSALYLVAAKLSGKKFVYWMSFPMIESAVYRARAYRGSMRLLRTALVFAYASIARGFFYFTGRFSDHIFVQSARMMVQLVGTGVAEAKVTPVPMAVDTEMFTLDKVKAADEPWLFGVKLLVYVGAIEPIREVDMLISVLAGVRKAGHNAKLMIIGGTRIPDRERLLVRAARENVTDHVVFTGFLPLPTVLRYVRRSDVCFSPCPPHPILLVGTPTKLVEYLAMGRPVVANDHPDQAFVLSSSGVGICVPFTIEDFSRATLEILADPVGADRAASKGPSWVAENRSYSSTVEKISAKFHEIARGTR